MDQSALDATLYWLSWLGWAKHATGSALALGVAYEFAADFISAPFEKTIDAFRNEELARLSEATESARAAAAEANARAAEANQMAERERLERVRIEEARADRHLSSDQQDAITFKLKPFAPIGAGIILSATATTEAARFAAQINTALVGAGWETAWATRIDPTLISGVLVQVSPDAGDKVMRAAWQAIEALRIAGVATYALPTPAEGGSFAGDEEMKAKATGAPILITIGEHPRGY